MILSYFKMKLCIVLQIAALFGLGVAQLTPQERAAKLLSMMDINDKISMVHGTPSLPYVGNTPVNPSLNIPALTLEDGPQGVADGTLNVTCWPSALTVVASWDPNVIYRYGEAMATEQKMKGTNVMLGPMINIARVPMGGRNFESYGEDPYLTSTLVQSAIKGIQDEGVIACAKHFVDNNQEYNRTLTSANVGERAQWELYYPGFQAAVDAGVGSIMCSYNRVNNTYACENEQTLNQDLKGTMGFQGWVMSDWGATHSTSKAANAGLDQQMPDDSFFGQALLDAINNGEVPESRLDDMVTRILVPMFAIGLFDEPQPTGNLSAIVTSEMHNVLSRELAEAGTVLLKNSQNLLPIGAQVKSIAVLGDDGGSHPFYAGRGSGHVIAPYVITPFEGISKRAGPNISVSYAENSPISGAVQLAVSADLAIVFVGLNSAEGSDRVNLSLSWSDDALVAAVAAAQPNTIVVVHTPGAVLMPWIDSVSSVVCAFLPGQEDGNAIASILFGDVNPSGKLPLTFPMSEDEIPVNTVEQYPGINNEAEYSEELLVGYRWYDANSVEPLFPFGHGLSYTTFDYANPQITNNGNNVTLTFSVKNTGTVTGSEVAQVYLGFPKTAGEPPQVLRRFGKVELASGEVAQFTFNFEQKDFSIWDVESHDWLFIEGTYLFNIGSSSRDIRLNVSSNVSIE
eukprot:TRINITY_DN2512_c0_g1_i1.p1 TRINITY_DN2512_c0_g1~~TRINITY_DN2512_c0_g1_i1.p1  ORF type:complete len:683 (+),score=141.26 TRINITY_DN2512_c0_g1_i1:29-2077(+)